MIGQVVWSERPVPPSEFEIAWDIDEEALESIFRVPGRNDPCHCGSGKKYKRCCDSIDREAWRRVMLKTRQADAMCAMLRTLPSTRPQYDPEPA